MTPPVFWVDAVPDVDAVFDVSGPEGRHAVTVVRISAGDLLVAADGRGVSGECEVVATLAKDRMRLRVLDRHVIPPLFPTVTVVQALPKSDRSELAVELCTEAGADRIIAWHSARCVTRWVGDREEKGMRRWRSAAATAAKQSRRVWIPEVDGVATTAQVREIVSTTTGSGGLAMVLHESGTDLVTDVGLPDATSIVLIVGPEGGIDPAEHDDFAALGAHVVRLGPEVLRTSTAGAVALGAIGALTGRWSSAPPR